MSTRSSDVDFQKMKPRILVFGVGGAGCNAVNNMIGAGLKGVTFVAANTDAQALLASQADRKIQLGAEITEGLGAGAKPEIGRAAAEESYNLIRDALTGAHMVFVTAGMGGGTGTGAAPVVARAARDAGIFTVGVVSTPFEFEGEPRMAAARAGIAELEKEVDTLIVIPNQNLFRVADDKTLFSEAFAMADGVLRGGVACITDLVVKEGLINLDFADVKIVMGKGGRAIMGTGLASGENRGAKAAEIAVSNPLLDDVSLSGARGVLISITGDRNLTLKDVESAVMRIRQDVSDDAMVIVGATFDDSLKDGLRVSVVATGQGKTAKEVASAPRPAAESGADVVERPAARQVSTPSREASGQRPATLGDVRPGEQAAERFSDPHDARRSRLAAQASRQDEDSASRSLADNIMARVQKSMQDMPRREVTALGPVSGKEMVRSLVEQTGLFRSVTTENVVVGRDDSSGSSGTSVAQMQQAGLNSVPHPGGMADNGAMRATATATEPALEKAVEPPAVASDKAAFDDAEVLELPAFLRQR